MTPTEIADYARARYNAASDSFFSDAEIYSYIWDAEMQLSRETGCVRGTFQTTTVAGQQEYAYPTNVLSIKRVTYNGYEVKPRSLKEVLDLTASVAAPTGQAYIYALWDEVIYLGPAPDDAQTLKLWTVNEPTAVVASSVLDVPSRYHLDIAEYVLWQMAVKDKNYEGAVVHQQRWDGLVTKAKAYERKMLRGQEFSFVKDVDKDVDSWVTPR